MLGPSLDLHPRSGRTGMMLDSPSRSWHAIREHAGGATESSPWAVPGDAAAAEDAHLHLAALVKRGINSHTRRTIILSSILGTVGLIAIVFCLFILLRYYKRRREMREDAKTPSMIIQRPIDGPGQSFSGYESRRRPMFEVPPPPPPKPVYIPNHPYASSYSQDAAGTPNASHSNPSTESRSTSRRTQQAPAPLTTTSHPYANPSRRDSIPPPQHSANPSETTYESFMSPLAPSPLPATSLDSPQSPVASTLGGMDSSTHNRATTFSDITTDTGFSRSSSAPLQPRNQRSFRR